MLNLNLGNLQNWLQPDNAAARVNAMVAGIGNGTIKIALGVAIISLPYVIGTSLVYYGTTKLIDTREELKEYYDEFCRPESPSYENTLIDATQCAITTGILGITSPLEIINYINEHYIH